ncbi:prenyltransferase [Candidatus Bathyarchaeota archaeon]|nr:prenyltransferase [Candidatus Bathyarchaeota archaeon]
MTLRDHAGLAYRVSRPRFWFYLLGPYTVGCIWGADRYLDLLKPWFFIYFFFFMFPANVLLYGVNDLWDYKTDELNPKKEGKEHRVKPEERETLRRIVWAAVGLGLLLTVFQSGVVERLIFLVFLFLSYFYSAEPIRFKQIPLFDSASNILYALPGVFSYYMVSGTQPPIPVLAATFMHTFSMHLFSAIPDIVYDTETGVTTTAVILGRRVSLTLCFILWSGLAALTLQLGSGNPLSLLPITYPLITAALLILDKAVDSVYWFYPYINVVFGGLLFISKAIVTPWG